MTGLVDLRAYGISPNGNYPKSTSLLLLNCRYSLLEAALVCALDIWEKAARSVIVFETDLATLFIINRTIFNIK